MTLCLEILLYLIDTNVEISNSWLNYQSHLKFGVSLMKIPKDLIKSRYVGGYLYGIS